MKHYFAILCLLALTACQTSTSPGIAAYLQPDANDTLPYPVYESYADLAPIFEQQNDTTYVINFWATWCKPCVEELPHFEELAEKYADAPLQVVMISLDFPKDVRGRLYDFVQDRPLKLPVVSLIDGQQANWIDKVDPDWGGAIPVTVIYKNGLRYFVNEQFATYAELAEMVERLL